MAHHRAAAQHRPPSQRRRPGWHSRAERTERWYGEYPSMYLPAAGLIQQVYAHLGT